MIYRVRHLTTYSYGAPVGFARCNLRLSPERGRGQTVLSSGVEISPAPRLSRAAPDFFGTGVTAVTIDVPHRRLAIEARSEVLVERPPPPEPGLVPAWEALRDAALASRDLGPGSPVHFLVPTRRVPVLAEATAYARESFAPRRSMLAGALDLMARIRRDFTFDPKATSVSTPLAEVASGRRGVCQDFAHFMIAGLRGLGLPAAYVSGYLRTVPPPGRKRLRGADASHAWVSVWCGEAWVDLDPTNSVPAGDDHIVLARGRDYGDVSPVDGIVLVAGSQRLGVEVDVVPQGEEAPEE